MANGNSHDLCSRPDPAPVATYTPAKDNKLDGEIEGYDPKNDKFVADLAKEGDAPVVDETDAPVAEEEPSSAIDPRDVQAPSAAGDASPDDNDAPQSDHEQPAGRDVEP